jgi:hypothetical protein
LRRQIDEDERSRIAEAIRELLKLAGGRIEPGQESAATASSLALATIATALTVRKY